MDTPYLAAAGRPLKSSVASYVYLICETSRGPFKIGISHDPRQRCRGMQTDSPRVLRLVWISPRLPRWQAREIERDIHEMLEVWRIRGEWFRCPLEAAMDAFLAHGVGLGDVV